MESELRVLAESTEASFTSFPRYLQPFPVLFALHLLPYREHAPQATAHVEVRGQLGGLLTPLLPLVPWMGLRVPGY